MRRRLSFPVTYRLWAYEGSIIHKTCSCCVNVLLRMCVSHVYPYVVIRLSSALCLLHPLNMSDHKCFAVLINPQIAECTQLEKRLKGVTDQLVVSEAYAKKVSSVFVSFNQLHTTRLDCSALQRPVDIKPTLDTRDESI